jgi:hypothetical protein
MINFIVYNLVGEILRYGSSQRDLIAAQVGTDELFIVGIPDAPNEQYVAEGELRYYSDAEIAVRTALKSGWVWRMPERVAVDMRALEQAKSSQLLRINIARDKAASSMDRFTYEDVLFDGKEVDRSNVSSAAAIVRLGVPLPNGFSWRAFDNTAMPMDNTQLLGLEKAMILTLAELKLNSHDKARKLKLQIEAASSNTQVDLINFEDSQ